MRGARNHTHVVHQQRTVNFPCPGLKPIRKLRKDGVLDVDRVHMNNRLTMQSVAKDLFYSVHLVVQRKDIAASVNLHMERYELFARSVVMNNKIVDSAGSFGGINYLVYLFYKLAIRRSAKERGCSADNGKYSCTYYHQRNCGTYVSVYVYLGKVAEDRARKHGKGGNGIADRIRCNSHKRFGSYKLSAFAIVDIHIEFYKHGKGQHYAKGEAEGDLGWVEDLFSRR